MAKIEQFSRLLMHRVTGAGVQFTSPTSNDHTDETWAETDLYIGEIGINVTDDTAWMRTNNGIVQLATSGSTSSTSAIWVLNGSNEIQIGATYAPGAIVRNTGSFVDLGTSTLRFKDLYLGGASSGLTTIDVANGFTIKGTSDWYITTSSGGSNIATVVMGTTSSNVDKTLPLILNSKNSSISGTASARSILASVNSNIFASTNTAVIAGASVTMATASSNAAYVGLGQGRDYNYTNSLGVGGQLVLRGVQDDGANYYDRSEVVKGQNILTTSNALTTPIRTFELGTTCGEVLSARLWITGVDLTDASRVYSCDMFLTAAYDGVSMSIIGEPIIQEVNTMDSGVIMIPVINGDELDISVKGEGTTTIKWLLTYEYHRIINVC